mgnify:CR=1 FL=1
MIRSIDILFAFFGLLFGLPILIIITIVGYFDTGSPIFRQVRVGRDKKPFVLIKFRTMKTDTASVASHLASASSITPFGGFLRKTKLDELPQLWNVLKGEMSLVGPRPGLFNQQELTDARDKYRVFDARPGVTGLAQVNEIDMSTPNPFKVSAYVIDTAMIPAAAAAASVRPREQLHGRPLAVTNVQVGTELVYTGPPPDWKYRHPPLPCPPLTKLKVTKMKIKAKFLNKT